MKKKSNDKSKNIRLITRKQAITKVGVTALTAASILFLSTKQSSAASDIDIPGGGWNHL